jgi:hypothetical protein
LSGGRSSAQRVGELDQGLGEGVEVGIIVDPLGRVRQSMDGRLVPTPLDESFGLVDVLVIGRSSSGWSSPARSAWSMSL